MKGYLWKNIEVLMHLCAPHWNIRFVQAAFITYKLNIMDKLTNLENQIKRYHLKAK